MTLTIGYSTFDFGKWVHSVDNDCDMLECPKCKCRVILKPYCDAIGTRGTSFCPYCGEDLRNEQANLFEEVEE